jgi:hypothetical protein
MKTAVAGLSMKSDCGKTWYSVDAQSHLRILILQVTNRGFSSAGPHLIVSENGMQVDKCGRVWRLQ